MLINGNKIDTLSAADRGLAYGDGLFETIRISRKQPVFLNAHMERLQAGAAALRIPLQIELVKEDIKSLLADLPEEGVLKIIVTRGVGGRGYRPGDSQPQRIVSLHPLSAGLVKTPDSGIKVFGCQLRLAIQPALAGIKHLNRLEQVLASQEWPAADFQEGLMFDLNDNLIEGTKSNVFLARDNKVYTPDLTGSGVAGVMRGKLLEHFANRAIVTTIPEEDLGLFTEMFICNSVFGIQPVTTANMQGRILHFQPGPVCVEAREIFSAALRQIENSHEI